MGEATRMERSYTKENLKRAKQMLKEYKHAKVRTIAYPRKRPTLLKQMKFLPNTFKDVKADDWFAPAVDFVKAMGLMKGVEDDVFAPETKVTRAMVVTVLYRLAGEPGATGLESKFTDVTDPNAWFYDAVLWGTEAGVVKGMGDGTFAPNAEVTREQMATFLSRFLNPTEGEETMIEELRGTLAREYYLDTDAIHDYAVEHIFFCTVNQIMRGDEAPDGGTTTFRPQDTMKRAECAQVLWNIYQQALAEVLPDEAPAAVQSFRPAA